MGAAFGRTVPQQPTQSSGKGAGGRAAFNQQLMNIPGFADSLQASQQRMAQDPNANMMRTQPAQGIPDMQAVASQAPLPAFRFGPAPNQPMNQYSTMAMPRQLPMMQQNQMLNRRQLQAGNPMSAGLGALIAARSSGGFSRPRLDGVGGYSPSRFGGKGSAGFSRPNMNIRSSVPTRQGLGAFMNFSR